MPAGRARGRQGQAGVKSLERWRACDPSPSPPCRAGIVAGVEKSASIFLRGVASTGHRGRVDARGRREHCSAGLTRTAALSASAPSRDERRTTPQASRANAAPKALRKRPSREVASTSRSEVRVRPGAPPGRWPRASTRPRWPVDAKAKSKNQRMFFFTRQGADATGWAGAWIAGSPSFEGLDAGVPLPAPSAARRHPAVQSKQQARAKHRHVVKRAGEASPSPACRQRCSGEREAGSSKRPPTNQIKTAPRHSAYPAPPCAPPQLRTPTPSARSPAPQSRCTATRPPPSTTRCPGNAAAANWRVRP